MKLSIPSSNKRVPQHTSASSNHRIQQKAAKALRAARANPKQIPEQLHQLNREWDVERALEMNASILCLAGSALALTVHRRFAVVPLIVTGFLLQHAIQGWCPPLPVLRKLGFRTSEEIERERQGLLALA